MVKVRVRVELGLRLGGAAPYAVWEDIITSRCLIVNNNFATSPEVCALLSAVLVFHLDSRYSETPRLKGTGCN